MLFRSEAKAAYLEAIISTGLPISYVIDTGGKGPHIGIVLDELVSSTELRKMNRAVLARLPAWLDKAVGRINQMERLPGTYRLTKKGAKVPVNLIWLGSRVPMTSISSWIEIQPIINPDILKKESYGSDGLESYLGIDPSDAEDAVWKYVAENDLRHSDSIRNDKLTVSCPLAANHKSGIDRSMSAFINIQTGLVWCSACCERVGVAFQGKKRFMPVLSRLLPSIKSSDCKAEIREKKLF